MENKIARITSILGAAVVIAGLAACAPVNRIEPQYVATPDPVGLRLASAVDRASTALQTLASVEQARNPNASVPSIPYAPQELRRAVSVEWIGPIEPIMKRLADRAGYLVQVNGDIPPSPVVVSLNARQKPVIEVLRDIGLQAGSRADIVVDSERKVVELNYAPVSGG